MLENCRISCFADEIDTKLDRQMALLKELGIGLVEFRSADDRGIADYSTEQAKEASKRLADQGIAVSALGSPIGKIQITDPFAPHMEQFRHVVELAHVFGTEYIRMFSFYTEQPGTCRGQVMDQMGQLVDYAAGHGVVLLHENEKGIYGDDAQRCLELMQNFYGDHFKCTFDFANFVQCGQDTWDAYELLKPYIAYVHVKDAMMESGEVVPAGQGEGQLARIMESLQMAGYCGVLSLEPHLAQFAALKTLEQGEITRKQTDNERAFRIAYEALVKLLEK